MRDFLKGYIKSLQSKPSYPRYVTIHWADYIELLCLANLDGEVSKDDVVDRLEERGNDLYEGYPDDVSEFQAFDSDEGDIATRRGERDDKWKTLVGDWFAVLKLRTALYGASYPFRITEKEIIIDEHLSKDQKVYIYLLLCSNLYLFDKKSQNILSSSFELLCYEAMRSFLPADAEIHLFGKNQYNKTGRYHTNMTFWDKINSLAADLHEQINPNISKDDYPTTNKGDGGLDVVAWIPTGDALPSTLIYLGQCACTPDWVGKQNDSSFQSWINKISFTNYINNVVFIPYCFRGINVKWFKPGDIRLSFLIDRKRILFYLKATDILSNLPSSEIVEKIIKTKEGVV